MSKEIDYKLCEPIKEAQKMSLHSSLKADALPDLDDLLQCPVCYEIPSGQIFQCNEGHHVCGRCKIRLDVCPVCRAFFFGTRNYAMEELIANVRKLRAFKLGGKVTTGTAVESPVEEPRESVSEENDSAENNNVEQDDDVSSRTSVQPPRACKGLFRCLCCKNNPERLPSARLLNHLRYFHAPDLIEGRSENGEYLQAWQFSTTPGRIVTAVRISDMGIFFLIIEISNQAVHAWLSMASSPWVAHEFSYTLTLSGNDREAIFSDCVWSVRSCEGSLKKRGRCLAVTGPDGRALLAPTAMNGKLCVRRTPLEMLPHLAQPRAVLRVANRSNAAATGAGEEVLVQELEPFLHDLQADVARLSRAFATLGREANALVRSEAEMRARRETRNNRQNSTDGERPPTAAASAEPTPAANAPVAPNGQVEPAERTHLSRNARRRMRQRLRDAFRETQAAEASPTVTSQRGNDNLSNGARANNQAVSSASRTNTTQNTNSTRDSQNNIARAQNHVSSSAPRSTNNRSNHNTNNTQVIDNIVFSGFAVVRAASPPAPAAPAAPAPASAPAPAPSGTSLHNGTGNGSRNKKKRRHRR